MYKLVFKDGTVKDLFTCTREEAVQWINEAENFEQRQARKQICFTKLYSSGVQTLSQWMKERKK